MAPIRASVAGALLAPWLAAACSSTNVRYPPGTVASSTHPGHGEVIHLPDVLLAVTRDGEATLGLIGLQRTDDVAVVTFRRTSTELHYRDCRNIDLGIGEDEVIELENQSYESDLLENGDMLEELSATVSADQLQQVVESESCRVMACGNGFELQPTHREYLQKILRTWRVAKRRMTCQNRGTGA